MLIGNTAIALQIFNIILYSAPADSYENANLLRRADSTGTSFLHLHDEYKVPSQPPFIYYKSQET